MKNIDNIRLNSSSTIKDALRIIDRGSMQIALMLDENSKLLGTITDGDIRRALISDANLDTLAFDVICKKPIVAKQNDSKEHILKLALKHQLNQIPIVDEQKVVLGIQDIKELVEKKERTNRVVLMVGGLGTRLRPLTKDTPKPMLKVGNKPILETIIEKFAQYGFVNITLCVNYKADIIKEYFKNGADFGVNIDYVHENDRMGTAGALSLLNSKPDEPFFVMNGDLLTNVNFEHLYNYHLINNSMATMCVREYDLQVPYGVVNVENSKILSIKEKPVHKFFVSAGIYMLSPEALEYIPKNQFFDMPSLFEELIKKEKNVLSFLLREYWLDIGRIEEYKRANEEYGNL